MYLFSNRRFKTLWSLVAILVTALIVTNATIYFRNVPTPNFLLEKGELRYHPLWRTAFYFHIVGACVCLATGPLLMFRRLIQYRRFHAILGYTYLNSVLWVAGPTGLMISIVANGGLISALGFILTGVFWWLSTWLGYRAIKKDRLAQHIAWMVRSYSISLSAVWFRLIQLALSFVLNDNDSYVASVWLSLLVSVRISESCIARFLPNQKLLPRNLPRAMGRFFSSTA